MLTFLCSYNYRVDNLTCHCHQQEDVAPVSAASLAQKTVGGEELLQGEGWEEDIPLEALLVHASAPGSQSPSELEVENAQALPLADKAADGSEEQSVLGDWDTGHDLLLPEAQVLEAAADQAQADTTSPAKRQKRAEAASLEGSRSEGHGYLSNGCGAEEGSDFSGHDGSGPAEQETVLTQQMEPQQAEGSAPIAVALTSDKDVTEEDESGFPEDGATISGSETGVCPLHECWTALMQRQLSEGSGKLLLGYLDSAKQNLVLSQEAKKLAEAARARGEASVTCHLLVPPSILVM